MSCSPFIYDLLQDALLHRLDVLLRKIPSAQLNEGRHSKAVVGFVQLAGQVESRHSHQLKSAFVDRTLAKVAIEIIE